jgi:hypothetical protein
VADDFFRLRLEDRREALEYARAQTGRPAHLLEKDAWVVWTLRALFESPLATDLTFKGGTSLSKAYGVIERFSEDIDLTCDIRRLIPELAAAGKELPASRSQAAKWTQAVRYRLPEWIKAHVSPVIRAALEREGLEASAAQEDDKLFLHYPALARGSGYVAPIVILEFGGRASGEPRAVMPVRCDMDGHVPGVSFPGARPVVMCLARTFWEKATAAHVYCAQGRLRGERYARHWHDLAAIARSPLFDGIIADRTVATLVARHKSFFFAEKNREGEFIDYLAATQGKLRIVPEGAARESLAEDYAAMLEDGILIIEALSFEALMRACAEIEIRLNQAVALSSQE